nr:MAG TPA: hypothetical protein [Caudoviricetes sp.]
MAEFHEIGSSQFTEVTPAGTEQIQISATQKTTLQKIANLFKAMSAALTGFTPLGKGAPSINSSSTILQAFQALYQLVGSAKVKILGNNGSTPGFVSWSGTTCYGILFDTAGEQVYIRDSWTISNPSGQTDAQWIDAIKAGKAIKFGGSGSIADLKISGWSDITKYADVQDPYIINGDTLIDALRKLQWMTGNNTIKTFGNVSGVGMMWWDGYAQADLFTAFYFEIETSKLYILFKDNFSELGAQATENQIISYIKLNGHTIHIDDNYLDPMTYTDLSSGSLTLEGNSSVWYTGSTIPTVTIDGSSFDKKRPTACFICPYNITPNFTSLPNTRTILHLPQNPTSSSPISGYRVYTMYCQKVMPTSKSRIVNTTTKSHIFINFDMYK